jgi:uncharacterized protein (TIGR00369 family)
MNDAPAAPLPGYTIYDPIDPFENHAGPFHWRRLEDGSHHFVVRAEPHHCNRHGIVHGGLMMTMIDLAMVASSKQNWEEAVVTVSQNVEFVAAGREGELIEAAGECTRRGNSIAFVRGQVFVGERVLLNASAVVKPLTPR